MGSIDSDSEESRKELIAIKGLPEDTTLEDIRKYDLEENRKELEESNKRLEEHRKRLAVRKGLPEDTTLEDINKYISEERRGKHAAEKGLPEDATMSNENLKLEEGVVALMRSSKSKKEWNANCDKVRAANQGYPDFWFQAIIASEVKTETQRNWSD